MIILREQRKLTERTTFPFPFPFLFTYIGYLSVLSLLLYFQHEKINWRKMNRRMHDEQKHFDVHTVCRERKSGKKSEKSTKEKQIMLWYLHIWFMEYLSHPNRNRRGAWILCPAQYFLCCSVFLSTSLGLAIIVLKRVDAIRRMQSKIKLSSVSWWYSNIIGEFRSCIGIYRPDNWFIFLFISVMLIAVLRCGHWKCNVTILWNERWFS